MVPLSKNIILKFAIRAVILIISVFLINACSIQANHNPPKNKASFHKKPAAKPLDWKLPIPIADGEFSRIGGWLSDNELVYITNKEQTSNLYSYDLSTGNQKLLFKSEFPIGSLQLSPSKKYILFQAAPSANEGKITIIDLQGNVKYTQVIPSYELAFEWNPYQESQILVTKFKEDWTFQVLLVDFEKKITKELPLPQPFLKWLDQSRVIYVNWDNNQQKLFAPLINYSLVDGSQQTLFPEVFQFSTFKNIIMTITVNSKEDTKAKYSFFDPKLHLTSSFTVPQLSKYSDWLVPFYDYNEKQHKFITFKPIRSGEADTYKDGFKLVSYDLSSGKSTELFKGLDNQPIAVSPSGEACLYGNRFEKVMDFNTEKITDVVKE